MMAGFNGRDQLGLFCTGDAIQDHYSSRITADDFETGLFEFTVQPAGIVGFGLVLILRGM